MNFIDLFCGIGGFRVALERTGAKCVFSAEINSHACDMYEANFGENPFCDVTHIQPALLPNFDILCGGFPCQSFSLAGKQDGFKDPRGTLFFNICEIASIKKPKVLLLENVKHLIHHDNGNTFRTIQQYILELGYQLSWKVLSAKDFGLPQHRERLIMVAVRNDLNMLFDFSLLQNHFIDSLVPFLDNDNIEHHILNKEEYTMLSQENIKKQPKSGLIFSGYRNKKARISGVLPNTEHLSRTHKQFNRIYDAKGIHPTLSSQEASGRYFIYHNCVVRKLSLNECFRIMGFPPDFIHVGSKSNQYARLGNSVCINMIEAVANSIKQQIF